MSRDENTDNGTTPRTKAEASVQMSARPTCGAWAPCDGGVTATAAQSAEAAEYAAGQRS